MGDKLVFKIKEIKIAKGGAYAVSRYLNASYKFNPQKMITASEGVQFQPEDRYKGGIITFSTDVNSLDLSESKIVNWLKQKYQTLENRFLKDKKINKIAKEKKLVGWTVGKYLNGRYTGKNGKTFDEHSISVELIGVDSNTLISFAEDLCVEFLQESVLVKDYNTNKVFFVDAE